MMTPDDLRQRLMTDPAGERTAAEHARRSGGELADVAEECAAFEKLLDDAMNVAPPDNLLQQLARVPFQAGKKTSTGPSSTVWFALAASLVVAIAVSIFNLRDDVPVGDARIAEHLAWHWEHDGPMVLSAALETPSTPGQVKLLLRRFGVELAPELLTDVRMSKICPTPDGAGAHLILATEDGPVTLYYMPRTTVADSAVPYRLADGMRAWVFNVEQGSIALVAEAGRDLPSLGQQIARQLEFPEELSL